MTGVQTCALPILSDLMHTVRMVRRSLNPGLELEGVLLTMFDGRTNLALQVAEEVKRYINTHYGEEISIEMLAERVFLAPSYLSTIFKKETGQNLSKFIKICRMEKAREMLEGTKDKIVSISEKVGYPNVSYFCQSFREYYGMTPQKYRDQGENAEQDEEAVALV